MPCDTLFCAGRSISLVVAWAAWHHSHTQSYLTVHHTFRAHVAMRRHLAEICGAPEDEYDVTSPVRGAEEVTKLRRGGRGGRSFNSMGSIRSQESNGSAATASDTLSQQRAAQHPATTAMKFFNSSWHP